MWANTGSFNRTGEDLISSNAFYFVIGVSALYGLCGTAYIANELARFHYYPSWLEIVFIGVVVPILGIYIAENSSDPIVSFLGYNMIILPNSILLAPIADLFAPHLIKNAFVLTAILSGIMIFAGVIFPRCLQAIEGTLLVLLIGLSLITLLQLIFRAFIRFTFIDWIGACLFSLYIGYDCHRASAVPKTIDNAIDVSIDIYLDVINLFLRILRILGRSGR